MDGAALFCDYGVDGGESETVAGAAFGTEEGLEYVRTGFRVHSGAAVGESKLHAGFRGRNLFFGMAKAADQIARCHGHPATLRHGIARIQYHVHDDLTRLRRINLDAADPIYKIGNQLDVFSDEAREQIVHFQNHLVPGKRLGLDHLFSGGGHQLLDESGTMFSGHTDGARVLLHSAVLGETGHKQVAIKDDSGEQIVEIVSYPGNQTPYCLHFLRVDGLLAGALMTIDFPRADH